MNIEIVRNVLYKAYLEDFHRHCQSIGGPTAEIMGNILSFEADRRAINITINSFGTELTKEERLALYPSFGLFWPAGVRQLEKADDVEQVRSIVEAHSSKYGQLFAESAATWQAADEAGVESKSLEDAFFEFEVKLHQLSFDQQMHYAVFYSWLKLKEAECRNISWLAECIVQRMKEKISNHIIYLFHSY